MSKYLVLDPANLPQNQDLKKKNIQKNIYKVRVTKVRSSTLSM